MNKIKFNDPDVFAQLEENAIDGTLIYDSFPPEEYKYFSNLSKLGYNNRHKGWSAEICQEKQAEYKSEYQSELSHRNRFYMLSCKQQENIRQSEMLISRLNKEQSQEKKLKLALKAIALMTGDSGIVKRNIE